MTSVVLQPSNAQEPAAATAELMAAMVFGAEIQWRPLLTLTGREVNAEMRPDEGTFAFCS